MMHRLWTLLGLVAALVCARASHAQDVRDEARALAEEGIALLADQRAADALAKLEAAEAKFHAPTHLIYMARARVQLDQLVAAHDTYVAVLSETIPNYAPEAFHKARHMAETEAMVLRARVAAVLIEIDAGTGGEVAVDGKPIERARLAFPVAVEPGEHAVSAGGVVKTVNAEVGQVMRVSFGQTDEPHPVLVETPPPRDVPEGEQAAGDFPVLATVALAVGGVALGVGAVAGVMTLTKASDIKENCQGDVCPLDQQGAADDAKTLGNVSTAMFIVGGAVTALGVVLLVIDLTGDSGDAAAARLTLTPNGASLSGAF